jgi:2'-5' RNA ligase
MVEEPTNGNGNGHAADVPNITTDDLLKQYRTLEETSIFLQRMAWARQNGITFDGNRDEYKILGYDRVITTQQFRDEYERGGIAGRVVDVMPDATWRGDPPFELIEKEDVNTETEFEKMWSALETKHQIGAKLQRTDKLSRLSTFAILLIGAAGDLESELPRGNPDSLLYLMPFLGGGGPNSTQRTIGVVGQDADASVYTYDIDTSSPRFGLPLTYNLRRTDYTSPGLMRPVHWTRVIHVAEGLLDNEVFGQPALERIWNLLIDLRKVTGGGAEAFWLRANQGLHLDVDKDLNLPDATDAIASLKEQAESYKHQLTRWLRTRGVKIETLGSDVANFSSPADAILTQIAGAKAIPKRILTGSEMGELASSQDRENFRDQVIGRQMQYAAPYIIRPLVDRLMKYGYLPTPKKGPLEYQVKWSHTQVLTDQERTAGALGWAQTNQAYGGTVFTDDEIREKWADKEPLSQEQLDKQAEIAAQKLQQQQDAMGGPQPAPGKPAGKKSEGPNPNLTPAEGEPKAAQDKFSSTQIDLDPELAIEVLKFGQSIPDELLDVQGLETNPHITVKYGLHTTNANEVRAVVEQFAGPITFKLGRMKLFKSDSYHVLYVSVDSVDLVNLNKFISKELEVTDTHDIYVPHLTIAYLKTDGSQKFDRDATFFGRVSQATAVTFSTADDQTTVIPLKQRAASLDDSEREMLQVLQSAIETNNVVVIDKILGVTHTLGGAGSGNFGHKGRPGAVGGSGGGNGSSDKSAGGKYNGPRGLGLAMAHLHEMAVGDDHHDEDRAALKQTLSKIPKAEVEKAARQQANAYARGTEDEEVRQAKVADGAFKDIMSTYHFLVGKND